MKKSIREENIYEGSMASKYLVDEVGQFPFHKFNNQNTWKMNTDLMFSSADLSWETPPSLFNAINMEFNFTLDPCCTKQTAKCKKYYTEEDNGLLQDWSGETVFVNPPYGRGLGLWVEKASLEAEKGAKVVMLIPARTDTRWFHDFIYNKAEIRFLKGRVKFLQNKKELNAAPFPTMLVIFNKQ